MKILLFSDSHLRIRFEQKKFNFLKRIIYEADKVIILGDFWEGSLETFDRFVNSDWKNLFPLLKEKHTVMMKNKKQIKEYRYFPIFRQDNIGLKKAEKPLLRSMVTDFLCFIYCIF